MLGGGASRFATFRNATEASRSRCASMAPVRLPSGVAGTITAVSPQILGTAAKKARRIRKLDFDVLLSGLRETHFGKPFAGCVNLVLLASTTRSAARRPSFAAR